MARHLQTSSACLLLVVTTLASLVPVALSAGARQLRAGRQGAAFLRAGVAEEAAARTDGFFFNYENHGGDWKSGTCASRERQSPINFPPLAPWLEPPSEQFYYDYSPIEGKLFVQNTGHSIAVELANQGYGSVMFRGKRYAVTSVVFHMHSEHTYKGATKPMEMHIVHKSEEAEEALIMAIPFDFFTDPGVTYTSMGFGVTCGNAVTVVRQFPTFTPEQCMNTCSGVPSCQAFVTCQGSLCPACSMFEVTDCSQRFQVPTTCTGNVSAYNKNIVSRDGYFPLGPGVCTLKPGFILLGKLVLEDPEMALWECKKQCSMTPLCRYLSVSKSGECLWYQGGPQTCDDRTEALDSNQAYQKVDGDMNIPLALLIGPDGLPEQGVRVERQLFFPADVLPSMIEGGTFFAYEGSLTAPPCTEAVTWLVRREPMTFSRTQYNMLYDRIMEASSDQGNYRAVMPLMGRTIAVASGVAGLPPPPPAIGSMNMLAPAPAPAPGAPAPVGPWFKHGPLQAKPNYFPMAAEGMAEEAFGWAHQSHQLAGTVEHALRAYPPPGFLPMDIPLLPAAEPLPGAAASPSPAPGAPMGLAAGAMPAGLLTFKQPTVTRGSSRSLWQQMQAMVGASAAEADRSLEFGRLAEQSVDS
mmetsp:Transcript_71539/g.205237  ORF Transcript_71539/g.205237 Transcript_71539/m.205237 type:complete len:638 (-) Transcript_71539:68-1981(-)